MDIADTAVDIADSDSLADKDFAACVIVDSLQNTLLSDKIMMYQSIYSRAAKFDMYYDAGRDIFHVICPQHILIHILNRNKYIMPTLMFADLISPADYIDISDSEIIDLLIARGYFPQEFYKSRKIMSRAALTQIYADAQNQCYIEDNRFYVCRLIILLRAMKNASRDEIIYRHKYWESEFSWKLLRHIGEEMRNELNIIMSYYLPLFCELYPAILFVYHESSPSQDAMTDIKISLAEYKRIFEFSADIEYQKSVSAAMSQYLRTIFIAAENNNSFAVDYLGAISNMIFNDYPQYIHTMIYGYTSHMPTFYRTHDKSSLVTFITNNIERCPHLHKFVYEYYMARDVAFRVMENYPVPNNPMAKYIDQLLIHTAPTWVNAHNNIKCGKYGNLGALYFTLIHNENIYRDYFKPLRTKHSVNGIGFHEPCSRPMIDDRVYNFRHIIANCVAELPQLISQLGFKDTDVIDDLLNMVGAIYRS
jgi:hypothetical protein